MRTQVSWLSVQTPFQYHFSDSSIGSLIKLFSSHFLWFETWASWCLSVSGVKVAYWSALIEVRQSPGWVMVRNFVCREGFQVEPQKNRVAAGHQGRCGSDGDKGQKMPGGPRAGPVEWTRYLCMFPFGGPQSCLPGLNIQTLLIAVRVIPLFGGITSKKRKKVLKREKALFEICHSKLDCKIVRNSSLHILLWAQICTSSAHCIKKEAP